MSLLTYSMMTALCLLGAPGDAGTQSGAIAPSKSEAPHKLIDDLKKPAAEAKAAPMGADVKDLVDRMQAFYEQTQDFSAAFKQDYKYQLVKRKQTSSGTVIFKKPGMMRWEYKSPSPKTFVIANERAYAYDPEAMLLTKSPFDESQLSASVTFLFGKGRLENEFSIAKQSCATCTGTLLQLTPLKPDPRFKLVRLEVDPKTAQVVRSIVIDPDGSENAITFSALKTNVGLSKEAFILTPPAGTQVKDLTSPN